MPSKPLRAIRPMFPSPSSWKIVRGDKVQVMAGKDKGQRGEVLRVIRDQRFPRVFVAGVNMVTRHAPGGKEPNLRKIVGYSVRMEAPVHYSNVMLVDPETDKPVRVGFQFEDRPPYKRVRRTRGRLASGCIVPWPKKWREDIQPDLTVGEKDTRPEDAEEVTYDPASDFTVRVPAAHRVMRELRELREAQAAKAAAEARRPGGGGGGAAAAAAGPGRGLQRAAGAARGYHCGPRREAADCGGEQQLPRQHSEQIQQQQQQQQQQHESPSLHHPQQQRLQQAGLGASGSLKLLQRRPLPFGSSVSSSSSVGLLLYTAGGAGCSWCGLAAAPLLM